MATTRVSSSTQKAGLVKKRIAAQKKIYSAKVALLQARLDAEKLNAQLVSANLTDLVVPCW